MLTRVIHATQKKDSTASLGISGAIGLGPVRMTALALGSAACGSLGALYDSQKSADAGLPESRGLGASGMVQGVMVATMLAQPRWPVSAVQSNTCALFSWGQFVASGCGSGWAGLARRDET